MFGVLFCEKVLIETVRDMQYVVVPQQDEKNSPIMTGVVCIMSVIIGIYCKCNYENILSV